MNITKLRLRAPALALVLAAGVPAPSLAQPAPPPQGVPEIHSFAMTPSGSYKGEPGSRTNLSYEIAPGNAVNDSVTLFNLGNVRLTFRLYATDAFNTSGGQFELLPGDRNPTDLGSWVSLPQSQVTVSPGMQVEVPFNVTVPVDAKPGDHAAAILASSRLEGVGGDGGAVAVDRRTGPRLYLRVAGPLHPALTVESVNTVYHSAINPLGGGVDVAYTIRNTGNARLGAHQRVRVKNLFGKRMKEVPVADLPEILPGNAVTVRRHFSSVTAALRVSAEPLVTAFPAGEPQGGGVGSVSRTGAAWAVPWSVLGLLVLVGMLLAARRRFGEWRSSRAAGARWPASNAGPDPSVR